MNRRHNSHHATAADGYHHKEENGPRGSLQRSGTHFAGLRRGCIPAPCILAPRTVEAGSLESLLAAALSHIRAPNAFMAERAAASIWCEDGAKLPLLSRVENLGTVEPALRGSSHSGRWRGNLQSCASHPWVTCRSVARCFSLCRHAQLRRPFISASRLFNADWGLCMDLRACVGGARSECGRGRSARAWIRRIARP